MDETQIQARQSPSKRGSDSEGVDFPATPSQKRLKIIEQALSQAPSTPTSPDFGHQYSPTYTEGSSPLRPPRTPVKRSRSSQSSAPQSSNDPDGWVAIEVLTPPPTDPTRSQDGYGTGHSSSVNLSLQSPLGNKKAKAPTRSKDDVFSELPEPYDTSNVSRKLDFGPPPRIPSDEDVAEAVTELLNCAHMFNPRIQALLKQLPKKIEELNQSERKRIAAEKSRDVKARRITALDKEVAELRARVRELEKQLH